MSGHHPHPGQPDSEDQTWSHERLMAAAVESLLVEKGIVTSGDVARALDYWASRTPADGASLIARCWTDETFAALVMENVNKAAEELGLEIGPTRVVAVANGPTLHNVLVCTLCSCYPIGLLGDSPGWYKSRAYRSRVVREPRAVLAEFGVRIPDERRSARSRQHRGPALHRGPHAPSRHGTPDGAGTGRPGHPGLHDRHRGRVTPPDFRLGLPASATCPRSWVPLPPRAAPSRYSAWGP